MCMDHHHDHGGHDKHAGHDPEMFRRRFWLSLALTVPLVVTSEMVMDWFGYSLDFYGMKTLAPVLGSIVFWWGGWPFLAGGVAELRHRQPGMMLLISMAIVVAYVRSEDARPGPRVDRVLVGRLAVPRGWRCRAASPPARDDAADLDGDRRGLRRFDGHQPGCVRPGLLVGAVGARHDHAAGPLAGDEGHRAGPGRTGRPGRAAPR